MITAGTVTISTTATLIHTASGRTEIRLHAGGSTPNYLGDASVSAGDGFPIATNASGIPESTALVLDDGDALYGICGAGTVTVNFIATN